VREFECEDDGGAPTVREFEEEEEGVPDIRELGLLPTTC
jgi:hypothetical protein